MFIDPDELETREVLKIQEIIQFWNADISLPEQRVAGQLGTEIDSDSNDFDHSDHNGSRDVNFDLNSSKRNQNQRR